MEDACNVSSSLYKWLCLYIGRLKTLAINIVMSKEIFFNYPFKPEENDDFLFIEKEINQFDRFI